MARVGSRYIGLRLPATLHEALRARADEESHVSGAPPNVSEVARVALEAGLGLISSPTDAGYQEGKRLAYGEMSRKLSAVFAGEPPPATPAGRPVSPFGPRKGR